MAELREDNPRAAALATIGPVDNPEMVALVLGLLYIGDQIGRLVSEEGDERGALIDSGYVPLDPYKDALEKIAKHEEHFGSGPPDDEMREIAILALAAGER